MYYIAENLELRRAEVAGRIAAVTGRGQADCEREVDLAIQRLFYWGAYADKYGGTVQVRGEGQGVWPYRGCFIGELMQTSMVALCR